MSVSAGLFIDVGTNYSVLDHTNLSFIYEDVLSPGPNSDGEFVRNIFYVDTVLCVRSHVCRVRQPGSTVR